MNDGGPGAESGSGGGNDLFEDLPDLPANQGGAQGGGDYPDGEGGFVAAAPRVIAPNVLGDGAVRGVTVGELNRRTSGVLRSVRNGERLIVTRHKDPQAVILSVRDAIELIAGPRIADAAVAAMLDLAAGDVEQPWASMAGERILLARAAADQFSRTPAKDRWRLRKVLVHDAPSPQRPLWLPSGRRLAPFSYPDAQAEDLVLVHDLIDVRELERELIGEEIWSARHRRDTDRSLHARTPWQR